MKLHRLLLVGLLASPALLTAQERVTISSAPRSGQVLSTHSTMEMAMDLAPPDTGADAAPPVAFPKMNMVMTTLTAGTTTVGAPNEEGRYEARSTMDDVSTKMMMNGQPSPISLPANPLIGQVVTFTFNRDRQMVDMAVPGIETLVDTVKKMVLDVAGLASPVTLAIGETSTRPTNFSFPMPAGAAGSLGITGDMRITLVSITPEGADRIAHLTTTVASQMTGSGLGATTGSGPGMTMQLSGDGTMDVNVDRGFTKSMQTQYTFDTTMRMPGKLGASMPPMQMHGTMKMSATTEPQ
jgi:hypothetical protein